ncbi:iron permease [Pasteurellaceae bacterium RH1A]|nr:iron permease [Pasteurellaceae bacterium RH1A]
MPKIIFLILAFFSSTLAFAKVDTSPLFVHLSDAMAAVKRQDAEAAKPYLQALEQGFIALPDHTSAAGKQVESSLAQSLTSPNLANFEQLSKALYAFEKEQNPVDYTQKRQTFAKRVMPVYQKLQQAVQNQELSAIQAEYKRFNTTWTINEKVVRETSLGHYGQIETAITLLRIAMLSEPANFPDMAKQAEVLGQALADFKAGKVLQPQQSTVANAPQTLPEGIALLEKSYRHFEQDQLEEGRADITLFIQQWAIFEGEVRTRDGGLYTRVESDLPLIMVKGNEPSNLARFQGLISDLNRLDLAGAYGVVDAMLILLREGIEALLIIMALLTALKAAQQPKAKRWVYAGAGLGLFASLLGAIALQQFFPALSAGTSREILEGVVGIVAVVMMLFVGAWLHSKSSLLGWKRFIDKQVAQALATGSLVSMLTLSFLSVFREGAETILFYAGMMPLISLEDLLLGIGLALVLLGLIALLIKQTAQWLPLHHLFKAMTALIYLLGFKILGVSVHALQLTNVFPTSLVEGLPNLPLIGFYANWQGIGAQVVYLILIPVVARMFRK